MRNVFGRRTAAMIMAAAMLGIVAPEINAETLPRHAPVPEISPRPASKPETQASGNQEPEAQGSSQSTRKLETPVTAPIPEKRPSPPGEAGSEDGKSSKGTDATPGDGTSGNGKTESPSPSTEAAIPPEAAPVPSPKPPEPRKVLLRPTPPPPPA